MSAPHEPRDRELGAALRALEVPEHAAGFDERLRERLRTVEQPERRSNVIPFPLRRPAGLTLAVAAAAAVAAVVFFGVQGADVRQLGPERATAATVAAALERRLSALDSLTGLLTIRDRQGTAGIHVMRWSFAVAADGDFRLSELPGAGTLVYSAKTGTETSYSDEVGTVYGLRRGLAPGPPDEGPSESILQRDLGAVVRALAGGRGARLVEGTYRGRPVWILRKRASLRLVLPDEPTDAFAVTVDQETLLPLRIVETRRGRLVGEIRLDRLRSDAASPADFEPDLPRGARADESDVGFRRLPASRVAAAVGYEPFEAAALPDGFERAETAVAAEAAPTAQGANPVSRDVVSTAYRAGLRRFVVTTRRAGPDLSSWVDPIAVNENLRVPRARVGLRGGAFAGARAEIVVAPGALPHLWAIANGLVLTVAGDLTRDELVAVAESLHAR